MVTGTVIERDEDTINKKLDTGYIEIVAETISVLGRVRSPLPFEVASSKEIKEDLRLKYRFLDLRNREVQKNIILRSRVISFIRTKMTELGFLEIETPYLNILFTGRSKGLYYTQQEASRKILCPPPGPPGV